jgi:hypothetical protein
LVAAGVLETLNILNKSNLLKKTSYIIYDSNAMFSPVIHWKNKNNDNRLFGYSNIILATESKNPEYNTHTSIMPFSPFLTRNFFGSYLSDIGLDDFFSNKLSLACFFSSGINANEYKYANGNLSALADRSQQAKLIYKEILDHWSFAEGLLFIKFIVKSKTSSHYTSNLLSDSSDIMRTSNYEDGLYVIDGNILPGPPDAAPNSFSILASAYTITNNLLQ